MHCTIRCASLSVGLAGKMMQIMAVDAPENQEILQGIVNRFIEIQVALECLLEDLRNLATWRENAGLLFTFDKDTGDLLSVADRPRTDVENKIFRELSSYVPKTFHEDRKLWCREVAALLIDHLESLQNGRNEIDRALSDLPKKLLGLLSGIRGNVWSLGVRRSCLLPLSYWPDLPPPTEQHSLGKLVRRRVPFPKRLDHLLELFQKSDPAEYWQTLCLKVDSSIDDILAIATVANAVVKPKTKPTEETISVIRAIRKGMDNNQLCKEFDISASYARKIRSMHKNDLYEL
jgi:hypothetical protein